MPGACPRSFQAAVRLRRTHIESSPSRGILGDNPYGPFGEVYSSRSGSAELSYTGQDEDTIWPQYDFLARQYTPNQGRWISPDPAGMTAASLGDPQTWNRYAYVVNDPTSYTDPLGMFLMGPVKNDDEASLGIGDPGACWGMICGGPLATDFVVKVVVHAKDKERSWLQRLFGRLFNGGNALGPGGRREITQSCIGALFPAVCYDLVTHLGMLVPGGDRRWMAAGLLFRVYGGKLGRMGDHGPMWIRVRCLITLMQPDCLRAIRDNSSSMAI